MSSSNENSLYYQGQRKYVSHNERLRFYGQAMKKSEAKRLFFLMLYYTGARISEVLNLRTHQIDQDENMVIIQSLKKRRDDVHRTVPLPANFVEQVIRYSHTIETKQLWSFSRSTASRYIKSIMTQSDIVGLQACAKGLRHGFAVHAIQHGVPLTLIKKWLGHASIETTEIYLNIIGEEERTLYLKMWDTEGD